MAGKLKSVWLIDDGDYSDYHVVGIFSTKENAEFISDKVGGSVSEYIVDSYVEQIRNGYLRFQIVMRKNGDTETVNVGLSQYDIGNGNVFQIWERTKAPAYADKNLPDVLTARLWAKSQKHAIKICNEHRAQMIANGEW